MVIGQSKYFSLEADGGVNIGGYSAKLQLIKDGVVKKEEVVNNSGDRLEIKLQTVGLVAGTYELRVFITDPSDGFIDVYREKLILES